MGWNKGRCQILISGFHTDIHTLTDITHLHKHIPHTRTHKRCKFRAGRIITVGVWMTMAPKAYLLKLLVLWLMDCFGKD